MQIISIKIHILLHKKREMRRKITRVVVEKELASGMWKSILRRCTWFSEDFFFPFSYQILILNIC